MSTCPPIKINGHDASSLSKEMCSIINVDVSVD